MIKVLVKTIIYVILEHIIVNVIIKQAKLINI